MLKYIVLILTLYTNLLYGQDILTLKTGDVLKGKIEIIYATEDTNDTATLYTNNNLSTFQIDDVKSIKKGYKTYFPLEVEYYSEKTNLIKDKTIFASRILTGSISLYKYEGKNFEFIIEKNKQTAVLQKIDLNNDIGINYKLSLMKFLNDELTLKEITTVKYGTKNFINLINKYNSISNPSYSPLSTSQNYLTKYSVGLSYGIIPNSFTLRIPNRSNIISEINNGYLLVLDYNRLNEKYTYMEQGISLIFRGFEYDRLDFKEKYEISELIIAAGFKFEVLELNKIKLFSSIKPMYIRRNFRYQTVSSAYIFKKNKTIGILGGLGVSYKLNNFFRIEAKTNIFIKNNDDYYLAKLAGTSDEFISEVKSDYKEGLVFSFGIVFSQTK